MKKLVTPLRVGLLVIASAVFLFIFVAFVRKGGLSDRESVHVFAYFRDASGLSKKSRVQTAGIQTGEIDDIVLEGNRARISLKLRKDLNVHENATLTKRSESLLGDYVLDLYPGSEPEPLIPEKGELKHVIDAQGMEAIFGTLDKITKDIQQVTSALRESLGGEKGAASLQRIVDNLTRLSEGVDETVRRSSENIAVILENFKGVSNDVRGLTSGEDANVRVIVENIKGITKDVRDVLGTVKTVVGTNEGDLKESVGSLKQTLARLDRTLANFEEVSERVKNGEGPVGKILADERLGQKISETVEDVSNFASNLTRIQTEVSVKSEYYRYQGTAKNTFGLRLITRPDKYYLIELVDDPRGSVTTNYVQANPPAYGQPTTQIQTTTSSSIKISAEFAKRFYFTTLRFGLIESTGGLGADLHFFSDALSFKVDAFNFSVQELRYPRLRTTLRLQGFQHLYVSLGADDILNRQVHDTLTNRLTSGRDFFVGGGIYFTDDDLKAILSVAPVKP